MFEFLLILSLRAAAMHPVIAAPSAPAPRAGARCGSPPAAASRALGDPLPSNAQEGDIPGRAGNEIRQIYRVYARTDGTQVGWLFQNFGNRYAFESTAPELEYSVLSLRGSQIPPPYKISAWIDEMEKTLHRRVSTAYRRTIAGDRIELRACFAPAWSGSGKSVSRP